DEDFSNSNLLSVLDKINASYRDRIRLQMQVERVSGLEKERDIYSKLAIEAQNELYENLIDLNVKYNFGLNINFSNSLEMLEEVKNKVKELQQSGGGLSVSSALSFANAKQYAENIKEFERNAKQINRQFKEESENAEKLKKELGIITEEERKRLKIEE